MHSREKCREQLDSRLPLPDFGVFPMVRLSLPPPMLAPACAAVAGALFAWQWPSLGALWIGLALWMLINWGIIRWPGRLSWLILALVFLLTGMRHAGLIQNGQKTQQAFSGQIETVEMVVREVRASSDSAWGLALVSLENGCKVQLAGPTAHLLPGQRIRVTARFSAPSPVRNPGGFDEARYLAGIGVFLKADVLLDRITILEARSNQVETSLVRLRSHLRQQIHKGLSRREAALLMGILIGDTTDMSRDDRAAFQDSGLSHLTAVSGANVAFMLIPITVILRRVARTRRHRNSLAIVFMIAFGFLTGWEPSVSRAILMIAVVLAGRMINRRSDPMNNLLFAITVMLLVHPEQVISQSFQLSFLATGGILLLREPIQHWLDRNVPRIPNLIRQMLAVNLAVQIAVLPVQISLSHQLSPFVLPANLLAMPLAEGATILGALGMGVGILLSMGSTLVPALMTPAAWLFHESMRPAGTLLNALYNLAELFSASFWPRMPVGSWPALATASYGMIVISCLFAGTRRRQLKKGAAVLALSCLLLSVYQVWSGPDVRIIILDVGQGDAAILKVKAGPVILIDAGTELSGRQIVRPALLALGISHIDLGIVTHGHQDHAGGFISLMEDGFVESLMVPLPSQQLANMDSSGGPHADSSDGLETDLMSQILDMASHRSIPVQALQKDDTMRINQTVTLSVLAPKAVSEADIRQQSDTRGANAFSLILRLSVHDWTMLLMGDCDWETEQSLVEDAPPDCDLLRVAHHGSAATTRDALLSRIMPDLALISVGRNDYGHPAPALLERLENRRIPALRTDQHGAITLLIVEGQYQVRTMIP